MNKLKLKILPFVALLACGACDTTEDTYKVGDHPKDEDILKVDKSIWSFKPDGDTLKLPITSLTKWEASLATQDGHFSISHSSGKGNDTITVWCQPNTSQDVKEVDLRIATLEFDKVVTMKLQQRNIIFDRYDLSTTDSIGEKGGVVSMTAYSSVDWILDVKEGKEYVDAGLHVSPGLIGAGNDNNESIKFNFEWAPNYTEQERSIKMQLVPAKKLDLNPKPDFTLLQKAGTRPSDIRMEGLRVDSVDVSLSLKFRSLSPVVKCGVNVYKYGETDPYRTWQPENIGSSENDNYNYAVPLNGLPETSKFTLVPFVENMVGAALEVKNDSVETTLKPSNRSFKGASIVNDYIDITTDLNSAKFAFTVTSDVEPLGSDRIEKVTIKIDDRVPISLPLKSSEAGNWDFEYNFTGLIPNQTYNYEIVVTGKLLPRDQGYIRENKDSKDNKDSDIIKYSGTFKTKGQTPNYDDNQKPDVKNDTNDKQ